MKKFQLHLDAVIVIILLFVGSFAFIVYQDYQYEDLLQETVDQRWEIGNLKANEIILRANLERCEKGRKGQNGQKEQKNGESTAALE